MTYQLIFELHEHSNETFSLLCLKLGSDRITGKTQDRIVPVVLGNFIYCFVQDINLAKSCSIFLSL